MLKIFEAVADDSHLIVPQMTIASIKLNQLANRGMIKTNGQKSHLLKPVITGQVALPEKYKSMFPVTKDGKVDTQEMAERAKNAKEEIKEKRIAARESKQASKETETSTPTTKPELGEELGAMFKEADRIGKKYQDEPETAPAKQAMDTLTPEIAKKVKKAITGVKGGKVTKGTAPSNRNRQPAKISTPLGEFSNPVKSLTIPNYPLGGKKRGEMRFWVESHPTKGERIVKQSTGKPSYSTYAKKYAIVTGDDGRTYFLYTDASGHPRIRKSDFNHPADYYKLNGEKMSLDPIIVKFIESAK